MAEKAQTNKQPDKRTQKRETARPVALTLPADLGTLQRAVANPRAARPSDILALQRTVGNQAVTRLIQAKLTVGPAGDRYEQEADHVAEQVMTMPAPASHKPSVQRAVEDEEEVRTQPLQRQAEEEEIQTKPLTASITPLVQREGPPEEEELLQGKRVSVADGSGSETIQCYSDFNQAPGKRQYDYKVMYGNNRAIIEDFGDYHIKFHDIKGLGVFDEFHIAFEAQPRGIGYFFYDDSGNVVPDKSSGLKATRKRGRRGTYIEAARAEAQWFVSQTVPVPDEEVEQALKQKEKEEAEASARQERESRLTEEERRARASASASRFGAGTKYVPPHLRRKPLSPPLAPLVQRQEEEEEVQTKPLVKRQEVPEEEEVQAKPLIQRRSEGGFEAGSDIEQRLAASRGGGSPLPSEVRAYMEPHFEADFGGVRVHTGDEASQLNRALSAQAFTHGQDIYLGEGKYAPGSDVGKRLLAHELTHVVQQGGAGVQRRVQYLIQRDLMTKKDFQDSTSVIVGERGKHNPILLDIDNWLEEYHGGGTSLPRKKQILEEMSQVKDWLDKRGASSAREKAMKKLWASVLEAQALLVTTLAEGEPGGPVATATAHPVIIPPPAWDSLSDREKEMLKGTSGGNEAAARLKFESQQQVQPGLDVAVKELQDKLNSSLALRPLLTSGVFDTDTQNQVKAFKTRFGVGDARKADVSTVEWAELDRRGKSSVGQVRRPWEEDLGGKKYNITSRYTYDIDANRIKVSVKIKFSTNDPGITGRMNTIVNRCKDNIHTIWQNRFKFVDKAANQTLDLVIEAVDVTSDGEDVNKVTLTPGNGRSDAGIWYVGDPDLYRTTAAHEFGHMLGLEDEYERAHTDYKRLTGLRPLETPGGPKGAVATQCADDLHNALSSITSEATAVAALASMLDIEKRYNILHTSGKGLAVAQAYAAKYPGDPLPNRITDAANQAGNTPMTGKYSSLKVQDDVRSMLIAAFTSESASLMGGGQNVNAQHQHGVEPRHVRHFAKHIQDFRGGDWKPECR